MRWTALVFTLLIVAIPSIDVQAGWGCGSKGRRVTYGGRDDTLPPYCWCCTNGGWVLCNPTLKCPAKYMAYTTSNKPPSAECMMSHVEAVAVDIKADDCPVAYYPMVCDRCTHRLRFPRCWERAEEHYPLEWLGKSCRPGYCCR
jgi:hypothetical protein